MTRVGTLLAILLTAAPLMGAPGAAGDPSPAQAAWVAQSSGTSQQLAAVSFTDAAHGHVVGAGGTILVTNDGGRHWAPQWACRSDKTCESSSADRVTADLSAVMFTDDAVGHAVGAGGTILATTDGGRSWALQRPPDGVVADLTGVSFLDAEQGYAVGRQSTILATFDGGRTWTGQRACDGMSNTPCQQQQPFVADLTGVSAVRSAASYAVGHLRPGVGPVLLEGDGEEWDSTLSKDQADLLAVDFVPSYGGAGGDSSTHGHAVGLGGVILFTNHGATTWGPQESGTGVDLTGVSFHDEFNGMVVGQAGTALSTTDNGQVWTPEATGTTVDLTGVSAPDASTTYAVGDGGTILKRGQSAPGLVVAQVAPVNGPLTGGITVTVTGTGFTGATAVHFGRVRAKALTVGSDSQLTAVSPEHLAGTVDVTVTTPAGTSPVAPGDRFSFRAPALGTWEAASPCPSDCSGPSVLLHDGRVLALSFAVGDLTSVLLFDPAENTWRRTASLAKPHAMPVVVVLPDGKVLVAGGSLSRQAEVFDPATEQWHLIEKMLFSGGHGTLLPTGKVLVSIDRPPSNTDRVQLYDPATETWSLTGSQQLGLMTSITLLADGRVLAAGGYGANATASIYDPASGTWSATGNLGLTRQSAKTVLLPGGQVLIIGGLDGAFGFTERYDPRAGTWQPAGSMHVVRLSENLTATLLPNGRVLVVGGHPADGPRMSSTEVFDPARDAWELATPLPLGDLGPHHAILLSGPRCGRSCGKVMILGGKPHDVYLYTPAAGPVASRASSGGPPLVLLGGIGLLVGGSIGILLAGWYGARRSRKRGSTGSPGLTSGPRPSTPDAATPG